MKIKFLLSFLLILIGLNQSYGQCSSPVINSFTPNTGFIGSTVTITGANFDPIVANNQVFFGATVATVQSASFGVLTVTVPAGATTAPISVKNSCNLIGYSRTSFNGIFCPTPLTTTTYQNVGFNLPGVYGAYNMLSQDIDGDGKPDIVVEGQGAGLTIARNTSTPGTLSFVAHNFSINGSSVAVADFDGDGKRDVFLTQQVARNTSTPGSVSFATPVSVSGSFGYQVATGDINNDGKIDLIGDNGATMYVRLNTSTGVGSIQFSAAQVVFGVNASGQSCTGLQAADLDGDGKVDIIGTQGGGNRSVTFRNTTTAGSSTISFEAAEFWSTVGSTTATYPYRCQIADFDKDGKVDLTTCNYYGGNTAILKNTSVVGNISLAAPINLPAPDGNYRIGVGDVNGDGYPDVVTKSTNSNVFSVYQNTSSTPGTITFGTRYDYTSSAMAEVSGIAIGDLDGDFVPDIATSGTSSGRVLFHRNTSASVDNTAPTAVCKNVTVALSTAGTVTVTPSMIDNGSGDACGLAPLKLNGQSSITYTCSDIGSHNVTLNVTDLANNTASCTATVTVAPAAIIVAGQTTVCQGQTVAMNANSGASYQWYNNGVAITGATNQNYTATVSGQYTVAVTNPAPGCSGTSAATNVTVNNNPTVSTTPSGNTFLCPPGQVTITASTSSIYQWRNNGVDIANATQQSYTATAAGTYSVRVIDLFGCSATSSPIVVTTTAPEINITGNSQSIADGDNTPSLTDGTNFGNVLPNTSVTKNFVIDNAGANTLTVTSIPVSGANAGNFVVSDIALPATIASGSSASFNLVFTGASIATYNATVTVNNDDCNEAAYDFAVTSEITCAPASFTACPSNITANTDNGTCNAVVNYTATASGTPAPAYTYTFSGATTGSGTGTGSGATFNIGTTTVTVTATNPCSNPTCTFTVTVNDNQDPTIATPANVTVNADNSSCSATNVMLFTPATSDNCGVQSVVNNGLSSYPLGNTTVTWTVTDIHGRTATATQTVTVVDNQNPTITCPAAVTVNADNGSCAATNVALGTPSATDNCGVQSITNNAPATFPIGTTPVLWTVRDINGRTATCTQNVIVVDKEAPSIACPSNITVTNDANTCGAVVAYNTPTATDNCALQVSNGNVTYTYTGSVQTFTVPAGVTSITVKTWGAQGGKSEICGGALDNDGGLGGYAEGTLSVTPGQVLSLYVGGQPVTNINSTSPGGFNGGGIAGRYGGGGGGASDVRVGGTALANRAIVAGGGGGGNTGCPNHGTGGAGGGLTGGAGLAHSSFFAAGGGTQSAGGAAGHSGQAGSFGVGAPGNSYHIAGGGGGYYGGGSAYAAGAGGGSSYLGGVSGGTTQSGVRAGNGQVQLVWNVGAVAQVGGLPSGAVYPVGTTTNTFVATDMAGNKDTCSFTVTVNAADVNITGNNTSIVDGDNTPSATDNTDFGGTNPGVPVSKTFTIENTGTAALNVSSINVGGSHASAFTVSGISLPTAVAVGNSATFTVTFNTGLPLGFKNATISVNNNDCDEAVYNFAVRGEITCEPAVFTSCPSNITVNNTTGSCNTVVNYSAVASGTPAPVYTYTLSGATTGSGNGTGSGSTFNVGTTTVTVTATNPCSNPTCSFTVTVQDNEAPAAICKNITVQLDATGNASIVAGDVNNNSSDNCGVASVTASPLNFTCANVGANNVTLTVTDIHNNTSTCTAIVTVQDNVAPVAIAQNVTVQLDNTGNGSVTAAQVNNGSIDACGIASITVAPGSFTCANVGANTVTLTVTDVNGNVSTATSTVTVEDNVAPVAIAQNITVQLDATGNAGITAVQVNNGSNDACGIASMSVAPNSFTCANVGTNTVTLTVTDNNGNVSTANATVTVQDNVAPVATAQNITVQLNSAGNVSITAAQVNNGSSDACGIASMTVEPNSFDCSNVGTNDVILTVTDVNGNVSTASAIVTVQDNVAPVVLTQNITIQLDHAGNASITAAQVNNGSNDACGVQSLSVSPNSFTCANVGANTVTLTVTDVNGNVNTATATVTVQDNVAPVAMCKNYTLNLSGGTGTVLPANIDNGSSDACGIASMTVTPNTFTCANAGTNTVTLTVTDVNGNVSSCTAVVTVQYQPTCNISVTPGNTTYTGGVPTNIYIGYGPQTATLTTNATGGSGFTYLWTGPTSKLSCTNCQSPTFAPGTAAGTYTYMVKATNSNGCFTTCTVTFCVKDIRDGISNNPNSQKVFICHAPPGNPSNTQQLSVSVNAVPSHIGQHGDDRLGKCGQTCGSSQKGDVAETETKLEEAIAGEMKVYPNPSTGVFYVELPDAVKGGQAVIMDMQGKVVETKNFLPDTKLSFDLSRVAKGVYMIQIMNGAERYTARVVIQD